MLVMVYLGEIVDFFFIEGIKVDKYFIGGVGDIMMFILVLLVVSVGVNVVKMFGCGLGYMGGMLDKLEVIFGFKVELIEECFI